MQSSTKATKFNKSKKRLSFAETKQSLGNKQRGKAWQRTNKRDQWVEAE